MKQVKRLRIMADESGPYANFAAADGRHGTRLRMSVKR